MSSKIIFIIGGARSGKSSFALKEASTIPGKKAYIATAEALDSEMKVRIERHKKDRGNNWDTYEEPLKIIDILSDIKTKYDVVVIDCLTLWLSNLVSRNSDIIYEIEKFINALRITPAYRTGRHYALRIYIVSNEVGMGIVPDNEMAREFRDMTGVLNQKIAETADEVYLVTAGIPIKIKNKK